jgi:penicillin-binding protein 2
LAEKRSRRFLPADPRVEEPYRLTPQLAIRVAVLGFVTLAVFAVLLLRLWALQVLSGTKYRAEASDNRVRTIQIEAPRGNIVDRNGNVLVDNVAGTSLEVYAADLPHYLKARAAEIKALSAVTGISVAKIDAAIKPHLKDPTTPVVLRRGIDQDLIDYLRERQAEFPGVDLQQSSLRDYPHKSLAAQVLGYVGPISGTELAAAEREGYHSQDDMGQAGIEQSYDRYLKGTDGTSDLTVNSLGQPTSPIQPKKLPTPGNTLRLTIDVHLQRAAEQALREGIAAAHNDPKGKYADGGAVVAIDPKDGSILALASNPTYEPSVFVSRDPTKLAPLLGGTAATAANSPGLNRALDGLYPPGSVWKPVTALAAMEEGILSPNESILCTPDFKYYGQVFLNWDMYVDQPMELAQAIAESCDTYFYRVGQRFYDLNSKFGPTLQLWASRFGFGADTGIDIGPENPGLVPTPAWRRKAFAGSQYAPIDRSWKPGYSVQLAIGQGDLEVTPIQMARFYAMIANGGRLVTPHVAQDVEQSSDTKGQPAQIFRELATQQPTDSGVHPGSLQAVQQGLYAGTHSTSGTSYGVFGQFPIPIAGKTGTAEKLISIPGYPNALKLNQSWWCGYGPSDNAQIVVCVVIENGGEGGSAAAPTALKVFESYFKIHNVATTTHISD